jgi:hypothetical protein
VKIQRLKANRQCTIFAAKQQRRPLDFLRHKSLSDSILQHGIKGRQGDHRGRGVDRVGQAEKCQKEMAWQCQAVVLAV